MPRAFFISGTPGWIRTSGFQLRRLTLYPLSYGRILRTLGTVPFAQFLRQAQILILDILQVCLRLKSSPSLNLDKIERFPKPSRLTLYYNLINLCGDISQDQLDHWR